MWLFSGGVVRNLSLTVVDHAGSSLSDKIVRNVEASPAVRVASEAISLAEAKEMMNKGETDAILALPNNLEKKVMHVQSPEIALYINNSNLVKGGAIRSGLYKTLATFSGGIKFQMYLKKGATWEQAKEKVQPVKLDAHILFNPFGNYSYFLALGLLPVILTVFVFLGSVYALGIELKAGTAGELLKVARNSVTIALSGKFLPYTLLFLMNAMVMNLILFVHHGTPLKGSMMVILLSEIILIMAYQMLAVLFLWITSNMRLSLSLGSAYTMMALTFSGLTFPTLAMPWIAKIFGYIFPYTVWLKVFLSQSLRGEPLTDAATYLIALLVYFLIGILAFPGIKKRLSIARYWGRS
jgi:ABC-2 type transport system permease protein